MSMFTGQRHTQQRFFTCGISDCETTSGGSTHSLFECFYLSVLVNVKSHQSHRPPSPNATNEMSPITACFNFNLIKTQRIKETHTTAHTHKTHNTLFCLYIYIYGTPETQWVILLMLLRGRLYQIIIGSHTEIVWQDIIQYAYMHSLTWSQFKER